MMLITHGNQRQDRLFSEDTRRFDQFGQTAGNERPDVEVCRYISLQRTSLITVGL